MAASARRLGTEPPLEVCKLDEESACLGPSLTDDWLSDLGFWGSDPLSKMGTALVSKMQSFPWPQIWLTG